MDFKNVHILVCDRDPSAGSETLALLQKCSYKVTAVKSAYEVVEALQDTDVDIVLTDVELPQEKGFKMLKHILRQDNLSHIAVIVMSDHDDMGVVAKCLHLGAVDYLVKPLRLNEVMNLWTHMWRKRRMLGLPDKHAVLGNMKSSTSVPRPDSTADLLSGCKARDCPTSAIDTRPTITSRAGAPPHLELSLRLSLDYNAETLREQAVDVAPKPSSPSNEKVAHPTVCPVKLKSNNQQPDEQSATNVCSPVSPSSSRRPRHLNENVARENRESVWRVPVDPSLDSPKDASAADENMPGDMESQICDDRRQHPMQCISRDERLFHAGQIPAAHTQGFQPCYAFVESPPVSAFTGNLQEINAKARYMNPTLHSSQLNMQQLPQYRHEATGMTSVSCVTNVYSCYPLSHLAVPVMGFSTWPAMTTSPPMMGGKLIQAERREAALSKFRMKRKGRCFEKKIRYASRKKLAEQRPRVRGQFVKRTVVAESAAVEGPFDEEEGEADDEQGCSELDNHSSPECMQENCRVG